MPNAGNTHRRVVFTIAFYNTINIMSILIYHVVYTLLGGFTGVLAYGMIHPFISSAIKPAKPAKYEW